jgi:hypothetical protein
MLARMIPTKTHAGMDYAVGLLLIAFSMAVRVL